jgi:hypothetical protein
MTRKLFGQPVPAGSAWGRLSAAFFAALASLVLAMPAQSASVSYILDQSNVFNDGVDYLKVTLSDGSAGSVDFKVEILDALGQLAGTDHFGIQSFAFNVTGGTDTEAQDVTDLPKGWVARNQRRMDGFGLFDIQVKGSGKKRVNELDFSITGVDLDTLASYFDLSTGRAPQGHVAFAALVGGLAPDSVGECSQMISSKMKSNHGGDDDGECKRTHSAYFGGPGTIVPVPAAVWLFGSGLGLLSAIKRRITFR